ncbi:RING finger protein unkempt homolog isoform X2 [Amia ocellicauda]|uniref:RING finger protein unkempt homolog isoform X2 n=1 Tax=Amia ocellicauda TaxID=2972642 RepID=UPI003463BF55
MSKGPAPASASLAAAGSAAPATSASGAAGGSASPASALHAQPEKPQHYTYLKEFRTEQCPLFVQHKCSQHRPFTCFNWHFINQRRRRPVRRRDGTFNYSPDIYCTKYEEGSGSCPEGDECPFLHRTAGDTERRYHLRYYKTGTCIHETDAKGHCSKNGPHCAFAHGPQDLRAPVYDIRELQAMEAVQNGQGAVEGGAEGQPGIAASYALIEKILSEEPRWQENTYVLSHYKTELCKKPPRLCRQGYACPYYHNSKDRRRSPRKHKYRSLPCPTVKHSDEWGDPTKCDGGDGCQYCHTRTEQQFHPEIYKSTKCNDIQQSGSCPRGPFCAFAHVDQPGCCDEASPTQASLPLFPHGAVEESGLGSPNSSHSAELHTVLSCSSSNMRGTCTISRSEQGMLGRLLCMESSKMEAPLSSWAGGGYGKAPGFEREDQAKQKPHLLEQRSRESIQTHSKQDLLGLLPVGSPLASSISSSMTSSLATTPPSPAPPGTTPGMNANALPFYPTSDTVESVVESALDDLDLNDFGMAALEKSLDSSAAVPSTGIMIGGSLLQSSAPVNIPGSLSSSASFHSTSPSPPIGALSSHFLSSHLQQPSQSESTFLGNSHSSLGLNGMNSSIWEHLPPGQGSPTTPPAFLSGGGELARLRHELDDAHGALKHWEESWRQATQACEVWKSEVGEAREAAARLGREGALAQEQGQAVDLQAQQLEEELGRMTAGQEPLSMHSYPHLSTLPLAALYSLQAQLLSALDRVEQAVFQQQKLKCLRCQEGGRVTLPCQHGALCEACSCTQDCPLCAPPRTLSLQS